MMYFQQGDILYKKCNTKVKGMKLQKANIVKLGTASGHAHYCNGKIYMDNNDNMFIVSDGKTELTHDEHKTIVLPKGTYAVSVVLEYSHMDEEAKAVVD